MRSAHDEMATAVWLRKQTQRAPHAEQSMDPTRQGTAWQKPGRKPPVQGLRRGCETKESRGQVRRRDERDIQPAAPLILRW